MRNKSNYQVRGTFTMSSTFVFGNFGEKYSIIYPILVNPELCTSITFYHNLYYQPKNIILDLKKFFLDKQAFMSMP